MPVGVGVPVPFGVAVGEPVGDSVGDSVGDEEAAVVEMVKDRVQVFSAALGMLLGTFGATG